MKELKIIWAEYAQSELEDIFQYYIDNVGFGIGQTLLKKIIKDTTKQLSQFPQSGTIETILLGQKYEYRYLVISNYKVIYRNTSNYVLIVRVFDCRLDPNKMEQMIE